VIECAVSDSYCNTPNAEDKAIYKLRTPICDAINVSWIAEAFCQIELLNSYTTPQANASNAGI